MTTSDNLDPMLTYLDTHYLEFENWGVLVAVTEDREAIFFCPLFDGKPDLDPPHLNWSQVTAPEPEFVDDVNEAFGTAFRYESFAGR
jgi:hypothetical protein